MASVERPILMPLTIRSDGSVGAAGQGAGVGDTVEAAFIV
jgi:hypothetical protein